MAARTKPKPLFRRESDPPREIQIVAASEEEARAAAREARIAFAVAGAAAAKDVGAEIARYEEEARAVLRAAGLPDQGDGLARVLDSDRLTAEYYAASVLLAAGALREQRAIGYMDAAILHAFGLRSHLEKMRSTYLWADPVHRTRERVRTARKSAAGGDEIRENRTSEIEHRLRIYDEAMDDLERRGKPKSGRVTRALEVAAAAKIQGRPCSVSKVEKARRARRRAQSG